MSSFESVPWCAALLNQPGIVTFTPTARLPAGPDGRFPSQDQLFKTSLRTSDAVPEYLGFYRSPFSDAADSTRPPSRSSPPTGAGAKGEQKKNQRFLINTLSLLIDLRPGVNGFNGTVHGGFIASLIDEAMGCLLFANAEALRGRDAIPSDVVDLANAGAIFTASMNVQFVRPIATPQVVLATATFDRTEGRKLWLSFDVRNGDGKVLARGEGLWMSVRKERL